MRKPSVVAGLLALAVVVMLHGNLFGPFYRIDDQRYVPHAVEGAWTDLFKPKQGILYGPVTFLSLRLDRAVFGPPVEQVRPGIEHIRNGGSLETAPAPNWAWAPRLMNGLYHGVAGFLLWLFLIRVGAGAGLALFVSFVWTAHPAALESVAWVCERKNVLCALFGFAALAAWAGPRENKLRWSWVSLFYTLALFSKLAAVSFVPILIALEIFDPRKGGAAWREARFFTSLALRMSYIVVLTGVVVRVSLQVFQHDVMDPPGGSSWTGLLTDSEIFFRYALNTLLPFWLSFYQAVQPILSPGDVRFWMYAVPLLGFWTALFFAAKRDERHWIAIGFLWFFGALGPNANIVSTAFAIQDRYSYIPMPGLLIAVAFAARGLRERLVVPEPGVKYAAMCFAGFILVMCGVRSHLFSDSNKLILDGAERQPGSGFAQLSAAWILEQTQKEFGPGGEKPDPARAKQVAAIQAEFYLRALKSYDYWMYSSPTIVRAQLAETLLFLDRDAEVVERTVPYLKPASEMELPIDPKKLYPELPDAFKHRFRPKTDRASMERAWISVGESSLKLSYLSTATPEQRRVHANKALECAGRALEFSPNNAAAVLLKGKALVRVSYLGAAAGNMSEALKAYAEGREAFKAIPIDSVLKRQAEQILKNVPPPEPPKDTP